MKRPVARFLFESEDAVTLRVAGVPDTPDGVWINPMAIVAIEPAAPGPSHPGRGCHVNLTSGTSVFVPCSANEFALRVQAEWDRL